GVSKEVQKHIITELGRTTSPLVAETLLKNYAKLSSENRALALATLLRRSEWAMTLLAALRDRTIPVNDLGVQGPCRLLNHPDTAGARKAAAVLEALQALPQRSKDALIAEFRPAFAKPADLKNGKEVFEKNCAICHKFGDKGKDLGPNLTGVG